LTPIEIRLLETGGGFIVPPLDKTSMIEVVCGYRRYRSVQFFLQSTPVLTRIENIDRDQKTLPSLANQLN
jgi:hypothetical protein